MTFIHPYLFCGLSAIPSDLEIILGNICRVADISKDKVQSKSRKAEYVLVRQVYSYVARQITKRSFREIGELVGVSHSNTLQAVNKVENYIKTKDFKTVNLLQKVENLNFNTKNTII